LKGIIVVGLLPLVVNRLYQPDLPRRKKVENTVTGNEALDRKGKLVYIALLPINLLYQYSCHKDDVFH